MSRALRLAVATAALTLLAPYTVLGAEADFVALFHCRAPAPLSGTASIYFVNSTGTSLVDTLVCSDESRHDETTITLNVTDWNPETATEGVLVQFRSDFGANCDFFAPIASLENQGFGADIQCDLGGRPSGEIPGNIEMQLLLFSAGDQPDYIGNPAN